MTTPGADPDVLTGPDPDSDDVNTTLMLREFDTDLYHTFFAQLDKFANTEPMTLLDGVDLTYVPEESVKIFCQQFAAPHNIGTTYVALLRQPINFWKLLTVVRGHMNQSAIKITELRDEIQAFQDHEEVLQKELETAERAHDDLLLEADGLRNKNGTQNQQTIDLDKEASLIAKDMALAKLAAALSQKDGEITAKNEEMARLQSVNRTLKTQLAAAQAPMRPTKDGTSPAMDGMPTYPPVPMPTPTAPFNPHAASPILEGFYPTTAPQTSLSESSRLARAKLMRRPERFAGDREKWSAFDDHMRANLRTGDGVLWADEADKIQYLKECLSGIAFELVHMRTQTGSLTSAEAVLALLREHYEPRDLITKASTDLETLSMANGDTFDTFFETFRRVAYRLNLPDHVQLFMLKQKIAPRIQRQLHGAWSFRTVSEAEKSVREVDYDQRAYFVKNDGPRPSTTKPRGSGSRTSTGATNPPQGSSATTTTDQRTRLTDAERRQLRQSGACFYCRNTGHLLPQCPSRPSRPTSGDPTPSTATPSSQGGNSGGVSPRD